MQLSSERELIVQYGKRLLTAGLTTGTGGNLSILNAEASLIAISPSGVAYEDMKPEDVAVTSPDGSIFSADRKPSSEIHFHLALYKTRPDIRAIVHTHSVYATTFACLGEEIPAVHYLVGFCGKKVPVAPYATFGTPELADGICKTIRHYSAALMENHGLVAVGENMARAFAVAEEIELVARIYYQTRNIGKPKIISDDEMERVIGKFKTYGTQDPIIPSS